VDLFQVVWVKAMRELLKGLSGMAAFPFRFLTPFLSRPSRRLRNSLRSDILAARQSRVPSKGNDVAKRRRWGIQGGMPPWSQDAGKRPRRGGRERRGIGATVGRGNAERFPLQGGSGRLNLQWSLRPFQRDPFIGSPPILHPNNLEEIHLLFLSKRLLKFKLK